MNAEARTVFGGRRQTTRGWLARLTDVGLVQKRGLVFRVSPFAREFVRASASVLKHMVTGEAMPVEEADRVALQSAAEGIEIMYAKGMLSQDDYLRPKTRIQEMMAIASS